MEWKKQIMEWMKQNFQTIYRVLNGKRHGEYFSYHSNGQLWNKGNYVNGKEHGEFVEYNKNGQLLFKENYVNGKKVD
jgi:antitoxin component YwqK of YwqJK toxin-antitoxin module